MTITISCPTCGKDDQVQKVTAIVAAGTHLGHNSGTYSGGTYYSGGGYSYDAGGYSSSSFGMSNLAIRLAPPPEPKYQSPWGCLSVSAMIVSVIALLSFFLPIFLAA